MGTQPGNMQFLTFRYESLGKWVLVSGYSEAWRYKLMWTTSLPANRPYPRSLVHEEFGDVTFHLLVFREAQGYRNFQSLAKFEMDYNWAQGPIRKVHLCSWWTKDSLPNVKPGPWLDSKFSLSLSLCLSLCQFPKKPFTYSYSGLPTLNMKSMLFPLSDPD